MIKSELSQKILVIRLSSLGDVVLTGPVYKSLKEHWPQSTIYALVKAPYASVLEGHPGVDHVIIYRSLFETLKVIRTVGFTHLLDLHGNVRSRLIRLMSRIPNKVAYSKDALSRRLFVAWRYPSPSLQRHVVDRYLEALTTWGIPASPLRGLSPDDWGTKESVIHATNILVMQTSFLGDTVLTLPLLRRLKEMRPQARISVMTLPKNAAVFSNSPWVDHILLDDKRGSDSGPYGFWRKVLELKKKNFDLVIVPHRSFRSALMAWSTRIPRRIGFSASLGRFLYTDVIPFSWLTHDVERNLALAKPLGSVKSLPTHQSKYLTSSPLSLPLSEYLKSIGISKTDTLVGIHPGATWPTKRWLKERFAQLCAQLQSEGYTPVLIGGPGDADLGHFIETRAEVVNLISKTDLGDLKAIIGQMRLLVTNDSGPMHLAAGLGVPVVAIFGATTRELGFFPYGDGHEVVETELTCRPCGLHGAKSCPEGHFLCMRLITVEQVFAACQRVLRVAQTPA